MNRDNTRKFRVSYRSGLSASISFQLFNEIEPKLSSPKFFGGKLIFRKQGNFLKRGKSSMLKALSFTHSKTVEVIKRETKNR